MASFLSFKNTVQIHRKEALIRRNALLTNKIKKMNEYLISKNTLSPIISYVKNRRREKRFKRQYTALIKSELKK